ncbi:MAG: hypothetical protein ACRDRN_06665 [Sciscionella sp.]
MALNSSLASLGVRPASELAGQGVARGRVFPVLPELAALLPRGGLVGGSTVEVRGSTSLLLALLAVATASGSWAAVAGLPSLGLLAAAELGVLVHRLALVPRPTMQAATVISALLDGMDLVAVSGGCLAGEGKRAPTVARKLAARARHSGSVLLAVEGNWPGADLRISCFGAHWSGLGQGNGRLRQRKVTVAVSGRGSATREVRTSLWLPGPVAVVEASGTRGADVVDEIAVPLSEVG